MKKNPPRGPAAFVPLTSRRRHWRAALLGTALLTGVGCGPGEELPLEEELGSSAHALATTVRLYEHGTYGGRVQAFQPGRYDIGQLMIVGNDSISSLQVPSGWRVTLYEHPNATGRAKVFTSDATWVGDDFNDVTSSVVVEGPQVLLYEHGTYQGREQAFQPGRYEINHMTVVGDDTVSSLRVPSGWRVTLYEHPNATGRSKVFTSDATWVGDDFDNVVSSLVVEGPPVLLYEHGSYQGREQSFQPGRYDIGQLTTVGNDSVSSLRVPSGWRVTLYEHPNATGRSKVFTSDATWVGDDFDNVVSSLVVESLQGPQGNAVYGHWSGSGGRNPSSTANRQFIVDYSGPTTPVTFQLTAPLDTYLYLLDANGNVLAQDDNSGANLTSRLTSVLSPGTYKLVAATYSAGQSGEFTLSSDKAVIRYPQRLYVQGATAFNWIYDDHDTGADNDVAVWRANLAQYPGYYSLGDVAQPFHGSAPRTSFVASGEGDVLARPVDYAWVWSDWGSGGTHDVSMWEPVPAAGYTCLGSVTVLGYNKPSTELIRCVRSEYVLPANPSGLWNDAGSGADHDVGIWQVEPRDHRGLPLSTFIARPSHSDTGGNRYWVLNKSALANPEMKGVPVDDMTAAWYAPLVWMHGDESYFPSSVEFFLPNVHESGGYMVTNQALGCDSCTDPQFLDGQRPGAVPIYAEIVNRTQGGQPTNITDIVYWSFYPYNNGKRVCIGWYSPWGCVGGYSTFGNHVGDWEHFTVRFVDGRPSQMYLSQHSSGQTFNYGDKNVAVTAGFHAEVYAAQGSHGLYPDAARHIYKTIGNGDFLADDTGRGIPWYTWNSTVPFFRQSPGTYGGSLSWLNSTSRWGNPKSGCGFSEQVSGECVLNDGPSGIMDKGASNPENLTLD